MSKRDYLVSDLEIAQIIDLNIIKQKIVDDFAKSLTLEILQQGNFIYNLQKVNTRP